MVKFLVYLFLFLFINLNFVFSDSPCIDGVDGCLFGWNDGVLLNWNNWEKVEDFGYSTSGWQINSSSIYGPYDIFNYGRAPRSFNKNDYGAENLAIIDITDFAPSTNSGGSFKVFETENSTDFRSTWWIWYDGKPLSERGVTNFNTDRMSFYLKVKGTKKNDFTSQIDNTNFDIGTYLCWNTGSTAYGTGDGCPYEGPGNQHYYHTITINPDTWIHVQ